MMFSENSFQLGKKVLKIRCLSIGTLYATEVYMQPFLRIIDLHTAKRLALIPLLYRYAQFLHFIGKKNLAAVSICLFYVSVLQVDTYFPEIFYQTKIFLIWQVKKIGVDNVHAFLVWLSRTFR